MATVTSLIPGQSNVRGPLAPAIQIEITLIANRGRKRSRERGGGKKNGAGAK